MTGEYDEFPIDETLEDGPISHPTDQAEREWLLDQRFAHGLLRYLHTSDAAHRESSVESVLDRIASHRRRTWFGRTVLLAATLLTSITLLMVYVPESTEPPRVEALVDRAIESFRDDADLTYQLKTWLKPLSDSSAFAKLNHYSDYILTLRRGGYFRLRGDINFGSIRDVEAGFDGRTLWGRVVDRPRLRFSVSRGRHRMLSKWLGDRIDLDNLDLTSVLQVLRKVTDRLSVERLEPSDGQPARLRVSARDIAFRRTKIPSIILEIDEDSGLLRRAELLANPTKSLERRTVFEFLGRQELGDAAYRRPW